MYEIVCDLHETSSRFVCGQPGYRVESTSFHPTTAVPPQSSVGPVKNVLEHFFILPIGNRSQDIQRTELV